MHPIASGLRRGFMRAIVKATVCVVLGSASLAFAQLPLPTPTPPPLVTLPVALTVSGNDAQGTVELPGGIGLDLSIRFEKVVGLTPSALDVSASLVDPLDPALLSRLLSLGNLSVPAAFPVLLRIAPSESSALTFAGLYVVSLHTHNLELNPLLPLSLVKSPDGGAFRDITRSEGRGSYRDDGGGGDFSEFLIAADLRPIDTVIAGKFDDLQAILTDNAASMDPAVVSALQAQLSQALALYQAGANRDAIREMRGFSHYVKDHSGAEIPDIWRANCTPVVNVAGLLRSAADTLRFSLDRKTSN
jgi:hypothetical protein